MLEEKSLKLYRNKGTDYEVSKEFLLKLLLQIYFALFISICIIFSINTAMVLFLIIGYIVYSMYMVNFHPLNPVVWFLPFVYLYHYSVILLDLFNVRIVSYESELLMIGWLAILTTSIILVIGCQRNLSLPFKNSTTILKSFSLKIVFYALVLLSLFHNFFFLISGVTSKSEASLAGINDLQFVHLWFITLYSIILVKKYFINKEPSLKFVFVFFLLSLFTSLNLGERDVLLSYLIITMFVLFLYYKPKKIIIYMLSILLLLLIPVLGEMKNIFTRSQINISFDNIFIDLFSGEFLSAGRNIETLLKFSEQWDYFWGQTFLWDIGRTFVPGIFYTIQNSQGWFNNTFHYSRVVDGYGMGFALSGEGYINFGLLGVIICYVLLSIFLIYLYNHGNKNVINFVIYINAIPFFIYVLRADLSNLFSPILKSIILPLLLVYILNEIFKIFYKVNKRL